METCFNYTDKTGWFSSDERKWISKIHKLKEQYPDKVEIIAEPESNDGCIYAKMPASWMKIQPPVKRDLSEEERQAIRDRLAKGRENMSRTPLR